MRRSFIDRENNELSIRRQCELLGFTRSNVYYVPRVKDLARENRLREAIDKQFMKDACGVIKMVEYLKLQGHKVGDKLIRRLMRTMNLMALYPKPKLSKRHPEHRIYSYLLKGLWENKKTVDSNF